MMINRNMKFLFVILIIYGLNFSSTKSEPMIIFQNNITDCPMYTESCPIQMLVSKNIALDELNVSYSGSNYFNFIKIQACSNETKDCELESLNKSSYQTGLLVIKSIIVGKDTLHVQYEQYSIDHTVIVTQPRRVIDKIHRVYLSIFQTVISTIMGILIDFEALKKIIKMPIPVIIGFCAQYGCMPLLAYLATYIFSLSPVDALALFIYGCCPGGSASNNWTILFNGDIDLSAIMTFVSTLGSLFLMPIWVYTLGSVFTDAANIKIPFLNLIVNLFITIGPCLFGLCLSRIFPKIKKFVLKIAKPFTLLAVLSFLAFTIYVKLYVFSLVKLGQWLIAPFVPWTGFIIGGSTALIFRLPLRQALTIALETGIQNVGIAFLIIYYNFPSPESDYAILPLISVSLLTTIPLWLIYFILQMFRKIRACLKNKGKKEKVPLEEQEKLNQSKDSNENNNSPIYKNVVKV